MKKQLLRSALSTLMVAGIVVALWPLGQTAYSQWSQRNLQAQWKAAAQNKQGVSKNRAKSAAKKSASPAPVSAPARPPWPATRIVIRDAGTDAVVLDGWDESTLRRAPGHLPASAVPGAPGNCVIAGHRNVYGSPFYNVDKLMAGAPIELQTPDGTYTYTVVSVFAATDSDQTVMQPPSEPDAKPQLTLITCTIPRTSNRIIVSAILAQ
jgi:sortase A